MRWKIGRDLMATAVMAATLALCGCASMQQVRPLGMFRFKDSADFFVFEKKSVTMHFESGPFLKSGAVFEKTLPYSLSPDGTIVLAWRDSAAWDEVEHALHSKIYWDGSRVLLVGRQSHETNVFFPSVR
jgi:hypothetical protein